jgi:hypothetical protein
VTERATATVVFELVHAGYLQRFKAARRNHYRVDLSGSLRHSLVANATVADVFVPLLSPTRRDSLASERGASPGPAAPDRARLTSRLSRLLTLPYAQRCSRRRTLRMMATRRDRGEAFVPIV